jgi:predicted metalloprotease with PDZ domain
MVPAILAASFLAASCGVTSQSAGVAGTQFLQPDLRYTFEDLAGPAVRVTAALTGDADGVTEFCVKSDWGGSDAEIASFTQIVATAAGRALSVVHDGKLTWTVTHEPGAVIEFSYVLSEPRDRKPNERGVNDYRTRVRDDLFQMNGNHGLLYPAHLADGAEHLHEVVWNGFESDGVHALSSFGPGKVEQTKKVSDEFLHSLFVAGNVAYVEKPTASGKIGVVISGDDWGFTPREFADLAFKIIETERAFFNDHSDPWYFLSVTPEGKVDNSGFSLGGTALTNSFALFCNAGISLKPDGPFLHQIEHVLAHEYFHNWNGVKFRLDGEEGSNYWFSEGFTEFFTRRMLRLAGLWDDAKLLADLNRSIGEYDSLGRKNAPNADIIKEFWTDRDISRLPYRRGDLLAIVLDEKLRASSNGSYSLDDLYREFIARHPAGSRMPEREEFLALVEKHTDAEFVAMFSRVIDEGIDPPLPSKIAEFGVLLAAGGSRSFDPGFDTAKSQAAKEITGVVAGSGAEEAGLKNGLSLRRASIGPGAGPNDAPRGEVEVQVDGEWKTIKYDAVGPVKQVRVYQKQ